MSSVASWLSQMVHGELGRSEARALCQHLFPVSLQAARVHSDSALLLLASSPGLISVASCLWISQPCLPVHESELLLTCSMQQASAGGHRAVTSAGILSGCSSVNSRVKSVSHFAAVGTSTCGTRSKDEGMKCKDLSIVAYRGCCKTSGISTWPKRSAHWRPRRTAAATRW